MMGKPVVAGTRIAVELILKKLAAGETIEQIVAGHPRLTRDHGRRRPTSPDGIELAGPSRRSSSRRVVLS